jgi:hypothetical protein
MLGRMTWIAPQITRQSTTFVAGERQMLESWLDFHRQTLLSKCSGLTAEQLRQRSPGCGPGTKPRVVTGATGRTGARS